MKISRRKLILGVGAAGVLAGGASVLVPMVRRDGKFVESTSRAYMLTAPKVHYRKSPMQLLSAAA